MSLSTIAAQALIKNFTQGEKTLKVLQGINIEFKQGESYAITGVSGSGKSTLLYLLGGLDTPTNGTVLFQDQNIYKINPKKKALLLNTSLGFVFQFHYLINELTVFENITLMSMIKKDKTQDYHKKATDLLQYVNLSDKADSYPFELSGGEQQRVSIVRAIFNKPQFLLADEPTGNLDANNAQQIANLLLQCKQKWNMGLIICSHDKSVYEQMNHIFKLENGSLTKIK